MTDRELKGRRSTLNSVLNGTKNRLRHISVAGIVAGAFLTAVMFSSAIGCETGTTQKTHFAGDTSDITTTPPATAHADPPGTKAQGQPPVPGSPTASNADGTQPPDDLQARNSSLQHHEVSAGSPKL
ncbi:MAG TPA: hypothetical protein VGD64_07840 [Acidisarcina sp.]